LVIFLIDSFGCAIFRLDKIPLAAGVSVPEVVPDGTDNLAKCWSEWQDLNLRPPRPERGAQVSLAFSAGVFYCF
jgi:hypothetical protein